MLITNRYIQGTVWVKITGMFHNSLSGFNYGYFSYFLSFLSLSLSLSLSFSLSRWESTRISLSLYFITAAVVSMCLIFV